MKPKLTRSGPALSASAVDEWSNAIGVRLPDDYRAFLLHSNGGCPKPSDVPTLEAVQAEHCASVQVFYGLGLDIPGVELSTAYQVFLGRIPKNLLPIGINPTGDQFCLCVNGRNQGAVVLWLHDDEHYPPTERNVRLVAASFNELLESFYRQQMPWESEEDVYVQALIEDDDWERLAAWLEEGVGLAYRAPPYGTTLLEKAVIHNALHCYEGLCSLGCPPGEADLLALAERNARLFYPEHQAMVDLIKRLRAEGNG